MSGAEQPGGFAYEGDPSVPAGVTLAEYRQSRPRARSSWSRLVDGMKWWAR